MKLVGGIAAIAAVMCMSACGSSGSKTPAPTSAGGTAASSSGTVSCDSLVGQPGWTSKLDANGSCLIGAQNEIPVSITCKDGSKLYSFQQFWGSSTGALNKSSGQVATDPGYKKAYTACG